MHQHGKLYSVQALRGVAAMLVIFFHIGDLSTANLQQGGSFGHIWKQGYAGVDLFFLISGFIMVYVTRSAAPGLKTAGRFLYARFTRIYPLWWFYCALMALYFWVSKGMPAAPDIVPPEAVPSYLLHSFFLLPDHYGLPVLSVGWTLIYEVLFYVIFAISLLMARKALPVILALWAGIIFWFAFPIPLASKAQDFWTLFTSPLNIEFIIGACVAAAYLRLSGRYAKWIALAGGGLFLAALTVGINLKAPNMLWQRVWIYAAPAAGMMYGLACLERAGQIRVPRPLTALGNWSYSLYLSHLFVLLAVRRIWLPVNPHLPSPLQLMTPGAVDNIIYAIICLPLILITGYLSYTYLEQPALRLSRAGLKNSAP